MINLKQINIYFIKYIILVIIFSLSFQKVLSSENKIIFKINDTAFTTLDFQKRKQYLDFVGNNSSLTKDFIINDYISANLFFEHYIMSNFNFKLDEFKVFENIKEVNVQNKREFDFVINQENIIQNIKLDLARKAILENIFNSTVSNLNIPIKDIDLLYKFKLNYINFNTLNTKRIVNEINNLENVDLKLIRFFLN